MSGISGGITVLAGFTAPNENQTVVEVSETRTVTTGSTSTTIYDVTAGKTFYVVYMYVTSNSAPWNLKDGASTVFGAPDIKSGNTWTYKNQFPITFTDAIALSGSALGTNVDMSWTIIGFEQ